jgi:hypothetical protein
MRLGEILMNASLQRIWYIAIIILFIAFCFSQYVIYEQNITIASYSDMIDQWVEAYGECVAEKWILDFKEKQKNVIEIQKKSFSPVHQHHDLI